MSSRVLLSICLALALAGAADAKSSKKERSATQGELGRAYLSEGNIEAAIGSLRAAVELDRTNWSAWTFLGLALAERGADEEAEKAFRTALRYEDERAEPHHNYGVFLYGQGRVDEAIVQYELALEDLTYRKPVYIMNNLAWALIGQGEYERAVGVLEDAVRRAPKLCPVQFNYGLALEGMGRTDESIRAYQKVVAECGDEVPGAYLQLGRILMERGEVVHAANYLDRVILLMPDSEAAQAAQALLVSQESE